MSILQTIAKGTLNHSQLDNLSNDDHPQYILANGSRAFTAPVVGVLPTIDNHLATKKYVDDLISAANSSISNLTTDDISEGSNLYYTESRVNANANVAANTTHRSQTDNPHSVTKAQVGLSNVDNTSDADKPISAAQQDALDLKYDASNPSGFETASELNDRDTANRNRANHTGTQTASTISDFDTEVSNNSDVVANTAKVSFPEAPENGNVYARQNAAWTQITIPTLIEDHSALNLDDGTNPHNTTKADVGLGNVDNTSDADKPVSTATQNALNLKADASDVYTQTELNNGQLDSRYYTESEVDALLETQDAASEITNTPSGNLAANNVQDALNELQGDIDTANTNITGKIDKSVGSTYTTNAILTLTQAEYDAIVTKDANTLYFIV